MGRWRGRSSRGSVSIVFFFSSRRRHTRYWRDWSSDVCSSDLTGSVAGILYAYLVRFLAPAYQAVDASLTKVSSSMTMSALTLGASPARVLTRVHLPLARSGVFVAFVLVLVDAIKELPLVLLLRPFGFSTVSVWVYELARENFWEAAALPSLVIVATALIPVWLLFRRADVAEKVAAPVLDPVLTRS